MSRPARNSVPRSQQNIVDDGLQVVALSDATHGKEVVPHEVSGGSQKQIVFSKEEKEPVNSPDWQEQPPFELYKSHLQPQQPAKKSRCLLIILVVLAIIVLAVTAAVVAVVEVRKRQSSQNQR